MTLPSTSPTAPARLQPVHTLGQLLQHLVEQQMRTGVAQGVFVIAGADRLRYRVQWRPHACRIDRLDDRGTSLGTTHLRGHAFLQHSLVEALRHGQLYALHAVH